MTQTSHPHFERQERTDPITGNTIANPEGHPFVVEGDPEEGITIYFESEETKQQYLDVQREQPERGMRESLDNPTEEGEAEG